MIHKLLSSLAAAMLMSSASFADDPASTRERSPSPEQPAPSARSDSDELRDPERKTVRVETQVGTFVVNENSAELLERMLAGEQVPLEFYAGHE